MFSAQLLTTARVVYRELLVPGAVPRAEGRDPRLRDIPGQAFQGRGVVSRIRSPFQGSMVFDYRMSRVSRPSGTNRSIHHPGKVGSIVYSKIKWAPAKKRTGVTMTCSSIAPAPSGQLIDQPRDRLLAVEHMAASVAVDPEFTGGVVEFVGFLDHRVGGFGWIGFV